MRHKSLPLLMRQPAYRAAVRCTATSGIMKDVVNVPQQKIVEVDEGCHSIIHKSMIHI
jgi:hypothetical protein